MTLFRRRGSAHLHQRGRVWLSARRPAAGHAQAAGAGRDCTGRVAPALPVHPPQSAETLGTGTKALITLRGETEPTPLLSISVFISVSGASACHYRRRYAPPSSVRTIWAPATSARSLARAKPREEAEKPQSQVR